MGRGKEGCVGRKGTWWNEQWRYEWSGKPSVGLRRGWELGMGGRMDGDGEGRGILVKKF